MLPSLPKRASRELPAARAGLRTTPILSSDGDDLTHFRGPAWLRVLFSDIEIFPKSPQIVLTLVALAFEC